ncbi:cupredoxin domain-containing protein [Metabacillus herbersteinensis]|uniref:Cupredoxin domain-containing protein n=1 Tax=Metabacillus herbersteinensis TaxID=283816 RepID=A0ABV6GN76_9BACI
MSFSLIILISVASCFFLLTLFYILLNRKSISPMHGMMAAMTIGMMVGILGGTILGSKLPDNLFLSTIIGMLLGLSSGLLIGIPISLLASLDGMLSGLMGGMMGAMLGAMTAEDYLNPLIRILFVFDIVFTLIVIYMLEVDKFSKKEGILLRVLKNPVLLVLGLSALFFGMNSSGSITSKGSVGEIANYQDHNKSISSQPESSLIDITANDFKYLPNQIKVKKDQIVTLTLINEGKVEHDLQFNDLNAEIIKMDVHQHGNMKGDSYSCSIWKASIYYI